MRPRRVLALALLALTAYLTVPSIVSAKPVPTRSLAGVPYRKVYLPGADASLPVCKVGQSGEPVAAVGDSGGGTIFFGENDVYWTYIELRPDSCSGCGGNTAATFSMAHVALYFPFAPETVTVTISVVAIVQIPCRYPNFVDPGAILCEPFSATFDCQTPEAVVDYAIPMPTTCDVLIPDGDLGRAFLGFNFVLASDQDALRKPQIAVQAAARLCTSYNPVGFYPYDIVAEYAVGNPVMYAEVEKCVNVPVRRSSWGKLKQIYR